MPLGASPYNASPLFPYRQPYQPFGSQQMFQGMPGGMFGQIVGSAAASYMMGQVGAIPFGFQNQGGNLHNNMMMQNFTAQHHRVLKSLAGQDDDLIFNKIQSAAKFGGRQWSHEQQEQARRASKFLAPVLAQVSPAALDLVTGGTSATAMGHHINLAGRNHFDPATGRMGLSEDSAVSLTRQLHQGFGFDRPGNDRRSTSGFTAGETGQVFDEMSRRGGIDSSLDPKRVQQQVKKWTGSLAVIREIFQETGRGQGSVPELINALEAVSRGDVYQLDGDRVKMRLRNMWGAARRSGAGGTGLAAMQTAAMQDAARYSLQTPWANQVTEATLTSWTGFQATGALDTPAWGRHTPEQMMREQSSIRMRTAKSSWMNQMGALQRISERVGAGRMTPRLQGWLDAAKRGEAIGESVDMSRNEAISLFASETGMDQSQVTRMFEQSVANERAAFDGGYTDAGLAAFRRETVTRLIGSKSGAMRMSTSRDIRKAIGRMAGAGEYAERLSDASGKALLGMSVADMGDPDKRKQIMREAMEAEDTAMRREGGSVGAASAAFRSYHSRRDGLTAGFANMAADQYNDAEGEGRRTGVLQGTQTFINLLDPTDPGSLAAGRGVGADIALRSRLGAATAGILDPSAMRRTMSALSAVGLTPGDATANDVAELLARGAGGLPVTAEQSGVANAMETMLNQVATSRKELKEAQKGVQTAGKDGMKAAMADYSSKAMAMQKSLDDMNKFVKDHPTIGNALKNQPMADINGISGTPGEWKLDNVTIIVNGEELIKNGKGDAKAGGGAGPARGSADKLPDSLDPHPLGSGTGPIVPADWFD